MRRYYLKLGENMYLCRGKDQKLSCTSNIEKALTYAYKDRDKLENIKNSLPKTLRTGHVCIAYYELDERTSKNNISYNEHYDTGDIKGVTNFEELRSQTSTIKEQLRSILDNTNVLVEKLSDADSKLTDLLHYIEFYKFSASEGYLLCKKIQSVLDERREIKDCIEFTDFLRLQTCNSLSTGKCDTKFSQMENRIYTPRVYNKLFECNKDRKRNIQSTI